MNEIIKHAHNLALQRLKMELNKPLLYSVRKVKGKEYIVINSQYVKKNK